MRMYQKKTGISYLRTVNAVTLMAFKFLLRDLYENMLIKNFVPLYQVKYRGATYTTRMRLILEQIWYIFTYILFSNVYTYCISVNVIFKSRCMLICKYIYEKS